MVLKKHLLDLVDVNEVPFYILSLGFEALKLKCLMTKQHLNFDPFSYMVKWRSHKLGHLWGVKAKRHGMRRKWLKKRRRRMKRKQKRRK